MCVRCRIARPLMPANEQKNVWDDDPHLFFKVEVTEVSATDGWVFFLVLFNLMYMTNRPNRPRKLG